MKIAEVYIEHPAMRIDQTYSYQADGFYVTRGMRVLVEFGPQKLVGFVDRVREEACSTEGFFETYGYEIKPLKEVLDREALLNEELYQLGEWMAEQTISPRIACFQAMLPSKIKPKSKTEPVKRVIFVRYDHEPEGLSAKQQEALNHLKTIPALERTQWRKLFGNYTTKRLEEQKCVTIFDQEATYQEKTAVIKPHLPLTPSQQEAFDAIRNSDKRVCLLHGATGSGKTEIYLQLAQKTIDEGRQVLLLVPEIALTPQMVKRVRERFGDHVAIYHSRLNSQEKYEQFMRVCHREVSIVVGTRSAVFMPFDSLGLIVLDEEHDHSYKQDSLPRYHCRDVAVKRGSFHGCTVLLGSATPSLESYARAVKGVYHLVELPERINEQPLPKCILVDVKAALKRGESNILTDLLKRAIADRLAKKQQVIILLNRRGHTPIQRCLQCNEAIMCPDCDIAMSYHKDRNMLLCHTCGRMLPLMKTCPECGGHQWTRYGFGTQRLEEELNRSFPAARVIRMDADTVSRKNTHEKMLKRFGNYEADILIGTQMIAKGLDYPLVTLVGVLNADALLTRNDFRSVENTFALIVQASGRSGRGVDVGEVVVQAFDVDHYAVRLAALHDYRGFFMHEMKYRHAGNYPPYSYLISLVFSHSNPEVLKPAVFEMSEALRQATTFKVLGPSELLRTFNKHRMRIVLKGKDLQAMIQEATLQARRFTEQYPRVGLAIDVNPLVLD